MNRADRRREREDRRLEAYHDGELAGLGRWLLERRLERDPGLHERLDEARAVSEFVRSAASDPEKASAEAPLDLWTEIGPGLSAIDRDLEAERSKRSRVFEWLVGVGRTPALTAVAAAALLLLTLFGGLLETAFEGLPVAPALPASQGALRYLDTSGRPVWVSEDVEGTTIIWLMETPADA